jgi:hypothetical protein
MNSALDLAAKSLTLPPDCGLATVRRPRIHCQPLCRRNRAPCTLAQSYRQRLPILIWGMIPLAFQLPNVRRLIGNFVSNRFSSINPVSPAGVWLCSARMPVSRISWLAGGVTLKKAFRSPFIQRTLYANRRQGVRATHTRFQKRVTRCRNPKVSSQSVQSHPRSGQIGSYLIGSGLAFARCNLPVLDGTSLTP